MTHRPDFKALAASPHTRDRLAAAGSPMCPPQLYWTLVHDKDPHIIRALISNPRAQQDTELMKVAHSRLGRHSAQQEAKRQHELEAAPQDKERTSLGHKVLSVIGYGEANPKTGRHIHEEEGSTASKIGRVLWWRLSDWGKREYRDNTKLTRKYAAWDDKRRARKEEG